MANERNVVPMTTTTNLDKWQRREAQARYAELSRKEQKTALGLPAAEAAELVALTAALGY